MLFYAFFCVCGGQIGGNLSRSLQIGAFFRSLFLGPIAACIQNLCQKGVEIQF